ncbi:MAG: type II toxin-antitoxin system HicA family toxin [Bacteroidia bacterium]|nr:type II toxin-antitoxin system HicA family toxin [Bacteroidia bacterium]
MKVKEIIRIIEKDGWYEVRQSGSHRLSNDLSTGLEKSILKQAQIDKLY